MAAQQFGMIGLGVMGQNLVLNIERNGYGVAVYNRTRDVTDEFLATAAAKKRVAPAYSYGEFVGLLERPRRIMLLVKAGPPVDGVIADLLPHLERGDLVIDGGNSHFRDTERRAADLESRGINFLGMGVSGGEEGALWGPSLMPGGTEQAWRDVEPIMTKVAAKAPEDGAPCVTYIGPGGSGHFVKMVHNGIEYGDMQLIAESYDILRHALDLEAEDFADIFAEWNSGELASYLIEVAALVFRKIDEKTKKPLVDLILDAAGQKGTGRWTTQVALDLGAAIPTITAAVDARIISARKEERVVASKLIGGPNWRYDGDRKAFVDAVRDALFAAKVCSYAQGMDLLRAASAEYGWSLDLAEIARIWRAGCIIRARLLSEITNAFTERRDLANLLVHDHFAREVGKRQEAWRHVLRTAIALGVPMPAMSASLAYYDSYRSAWLPANLTQAQRDHFGAHTFERIDEPGVAHHENWTST